MGKLISFKEIKAGKLKEQLLQKYGYINKYKLAMMLLTQDELEEIEELLEYQGDD